MKKLPLPVHLLGICLAVGTLLGPAGEWGTARAQAAAEPKIRLDREPLSPETRKATSFAPIVEKVAPSVVTIYSTKRVKDARAESPILNDPFFRRFFGFEGEENGGSGRPRERQEHSLGSGVIISADGYILSNSHVVENAEEIRIRLAKGDNDLTAKVIGVDPQTDISVLKIQATNLVPITMTDSANLRVGDVVLAAGNPFGVGQTVTLGIVSGIGRGGFGIVDYEDFIQTDASINPGNSGGALVDAEGRLVGINTAILSRTGGNMGIGFAVPINMARNVMDRIVKEGRVVRGYLGIYVQPITSELAREFKLPDQSGALIGGVTPNSPAAQAGLQAGDVVIAINGKKVTDSRNLRLTVAQTRPNSDITLTVLRNGQEKTVTARLAELPAQEPPTPTGRPSGAPTGGEALNGVLVVDLDSKFRQQFSIPEEVTGALVMRVDPNSSAFEAGIRPGDIIQEINRRKVNTAQEAIEHGKKATDARLLLRVWSKGGSRFVVVEPRK